MSSYSHILSFGLLFYIFYFVSQQRQKILNKHWWAYLIFPIVCYSFVVGTRWGWGTDYGWYKLRYENPNYYTDEDPGFRFINVFLNNLGLSYVGAYITYSLVFIAGGLILLRSYQQNKYMLFLFVLVTLGFSTQAIRQAFAHAFVFIAIYFLNMDSKLKWVCFTVTIPIIYSIHPAALITLVLLVISFFFDRTVPLKTSLVIYIVIALSTNFLTDIVTANFYQFTQYIPLFDTKFISYIENGERWFGSEAVEEERIQSFLAFVLSTIYYCSVIYLTLIALKYKYNKNVAYIFNVFYFGACGTKAFQLFEILLRIVQPLECLVFIPLGYAVSFFSHKKTCSNMTEKEQFWSKIALFSVVTYIILYYGRFLFFYSKSAFVWDK